MKPFTYDFSKEKDDIEVTEREVKRIAKLTEDENNESIDEYGENGHHPVHIGEIFCARYEVKQKLGWGHFSTVWLAKDHMTNTFVALKVMKSKKSYYDSGLDEIDLLKAISSFCKNKEWADRAKKYIGEANEYSCCVQLLNHFDLYGPNGKHLAMVFEIMGPDLYGVIKYYKYKGIPLKHTKKIVKELLVGLCYLHRVVNIIHTDLKPENAVVSLDESLISSIAVNESFSGIEKFKFLLKDKPLPQFKWADFGNACWINKHFSNTIQTLEYRAPEAIIRAPYDKSTDIWSFGCIVFELVTGDCLFTPKSNGKYSEEDDLLAQIAELIKSPPKYFALSGKHSKVRI